MAVAVQSDMVPGGEDLRGQPGVAPDLLADEEERRCAPRRREDLEHGRSPLRVGSVVERERVAGAASRAILDPRARRAAGRRVRAIPGST